jgi:lysyl-tRNA synthetase class 1
MKLTQEFDLGDDTEEIIGRGTWIDKIALEAIERKDKLEGDHPSIIRTESGLGASGFPHIGSFADASRGYAFKLAIEAQGRESEFIPFSDDMDGLRRVPVGTPPELEEHLGKPVSTIPDPWGCHKSYGEHMSSLLLESLETVGIEFNPQSAYKLYTSGKLEPQVKKILTNAKLAGEIIKEVTDQDKYLEVLPYNAICENCGRIYTTQAINFDEKKGLVEYICGGEEISGRKYEGCNHRGWSDISKGEGKLTWKVEFAARWDLLQIDFEAFGKDIFESVITNDRVCKEILGYEPPAHARYEVFLDKGGSKISKSKGNVFTPQDWLKYGSAQSLALLTYKRMTGTRSLALDDIPIYMKEMDYLEDVYFNKIKESNPARKRKLTGLYEYCWHLKPPEKPSLQVPYNLIVNLIAVAPKKSREEFLETRLMEYGYLRDGAKLSDIKDRCEYATNWVNDFKSVEDIKIDLTNEQKAAIKTLTESLKGLEEADAIQNAIFETAKNHDIKPRDFFKLLYQILLNTDRGPKLGPYIHTIGVNHIIKTLNKNLE